VNPARAAILIQPAWHDQLLAPDCRAELAARAEVVDTGGTQITADDLPRLLSGARACLTGWGTPPFSVELLDACPDLGLIAHTAGSLRQLIPAAAWERGIKVSHAAAAMAEAVAEHVVAQALLCLQRLHEADRLMREGEWFGIRDGLPRRLLGAQTVGIWGAGRVGRLAARRFLAFGCRVLVSDPYLPAAEAREIGLEPVGLEELFARSTLVSLHAPLLDETRGRIDAALLARLPDGGVVINSGRAGLVDEEALFNELRSGRIRAALDVYPVEPLAADSPYRRLPNTVLSAHQAGHSLETHLLQGRTMVEEVVRFLRGQPLQFEVTAQMLPLIA
jgi:phosphoglycerate dehydrogenase-like enzyme